MRGVYVCPQNGVIAANELDIREDIPENKLNEYKESDAFDKKFPKHGLEKNIYNLPKRSLGSMTRNFF